MISVHFCVSVTDSLRFMEKENLNVFVQNVLFASSLLCCSILILVLTVTLFFYDLLCNITWNVKK